MSSHNEDVVVAKATDLEKGMGMQVEVGDKVLALFRTHNDEYYAINNRCPHQGAPLSEGHLDDNIVTCPWHAWTFDISNGACETVPQDRVCSYKAYINRGNILLNVPKDDL